MRKLSAGPNIVLAIGLMLALVPALPVPAALAQSAKSNIPDVPTPPRDPSIHINVQVDTSKREPVTGLSQANFTLLDNGQPRTISSFRELTPATQPVKAILVLDAVNTPYSTVAYERNQLEKFLRNSGPKTPVPMAIAVLTDKGLQIQQQFSQDTSALSNLVGNAVIQLRDVTRAAGFWGAEERMDVSIRSIQQLIQSAQGMPGRKLILLVSPGWPLLSGPGIQLDARQQNQIFANVVSINSMMRHGDVTLYALNTIGPSESLARENYYQSFLKGVRRPSDTDLGDLSIQVLAAQSGGIVVNSTDLVGTISRALQDANSWYQITFDPPPADKPNEYHQLQVKVDRPGVVVRAPDGYYNEPH